MDTAVQCAVYSKVLRVLSRVHRDLLWLCSMKKNVTMSRMVLVLFRERYQAAQQQHRTEDIC